MANAADNVLNEYVQVTLTVTLIVTNKNSTEDINNLNKSAFLCLLTSSSHRNCMSVPVK